MRTIFRKLTWIAGGLVLPVVLVIGGCWLFLDHTADKMCNNKIIDNTILPEINNRIVVFQRDCGATTGFNMQITMLVIGEKLPNESGNIFVADTHHDKAPSDEAGGLEVVVEVISDNPIRILYPPAVRVFNKQKQWEGVTIEYGRLQAASNANALGR